MRTKRKATPKPAKQTAIVRREPVSLAEAIEKVLIGGDLAPLDVEQRMDYYKKVCQSLGLNPLTRPFDYIIFNGKMTLYARRDCTDQLRKIYGVSVTGIKKETIEGMYVVEAEVKDRNGRTDTGTGAIFIGNLAKLDLANAIMKAETKAKRRATLSICGLGFLDQSEVDAIGDYNEITPSGRVIVENGKTLAPAQITEEQLKKYESITITPLKDGRVSLAGNGLAIVRAELAPDGLADLDIKVNVRSHMTHMPAANVFKFIDRAKRCNVEATLAEDSPDAPQRRGKAG